MVVDKKGRPIPDKDKSDTDVVPYLYEGGITAYMEREVLPYTPDAWMDKNKTQLGYEVNFNKYFYRPKRIREVASIIKDLRMLEAKTDGILEELLPKCQAKLKLN